MPTYPTIILPSLKHKLIKSDSLPSNTCFIRSIRNKPQIKSRERLKEKIGSILSASEFYNGISCNLYFVFNERHASFNVKDPSNKGLNTHWESPNPPMKPIEGDYEHVHWQGYFGFFLKKISKFEAEIPIKKNGKLLRHDKCFLKIVHAPTQCNFWHFNLFLFAEHSKTKMIYNLNDTVHGPSKSQVPRIAASLIDEISEYLSIYKQLRPHYLSKNKYLI